MRFSSFAFESLLPEDVAAREFIAASGASASMKEVEVLPPPPPSFSEEELTAARKLAYEEGFMAGKNEGKREVDHEALQLQQEINQALSYITRNLEILALEQQTYRAEKQQELGKLVIACAEKVAVEALRKEPLADIDAMVNDCLGALMGKPEVVIQVHPKLQQPLAQKFRGQAKISASEGMNPIDCKISWQYGEARREIDYIWAQIEEIIERYFTISANEISRQLPVNVENAHADEVHSTAIESTAEGENHG